VHLGSISLACGFYPLTLSDPLLYPSFLYASLVPSYFVDNVIFYQLTFNSQDYPHSEASSPTIAPRVETAFPLVADSSNPEAYTVGVICAPTVEKVAACCFLDKNHPRLESQPAGDNNDYTLGQIGEHNVVIAGLPSGRYGTTNAAIVARDMVRTFPNIRFGLMVGIGGGAPSKDHDIRLGDVVVGTSKNGKNELLQYDFGKTIQNRSFQRIETRNNTPLVLQNAVGGLAADYNLNGHQLQKSILAALKAHKRIKRQYKKPDARSDILYKSDYLHANESGGACSVICGDKSEHVTTRSALPNNDEEDDSDSDEVSRDDPTIHYGLIASANQLMKNAEIRDSLAEEAGVLCFEMEAAGLQDHFPCLVIRGICDYSDTHKNDQWHGYAAISAAAYPKDLLNRIPPSNVKAERKIHDILSSS
jgi:nucleoside phosphorylase